jgi:N-methylhydantoinase A/oxoprolinase/acetone carboxylase beta subunit
MPYSVAVDIGGTFTDLVAYDEDNQSIIFTKSATTYGNFVTGVLDCFAKARLEPQAATYLNHGTTLVINSLIERKGAKAARRVFAMCWRLLAAIGRTRSICTIDATIRSFRARCGSR